MKCYIMNRCIQLSSLSACKTQQNCEVLNLRKLSNGHKVFRKLLSSLQAEDNRCVGLDCGSDTYGDPLPACPSGLLNQKFGVPVDSENDGCVDPYSKDANGFCSVIKNENDQTPPKLIVLEKMCVLPGTTTLTQQLLTRLQNNKIQPGVALGECEECGRSNQIPCVTNDFGGCFVNEGFVKDPTTVNFCPPAESVFSPGCASVDPQGCACYRMIPQQSRM
jgi:hypothetical protein